MMSRIQGTWPVLVYDEPLQVPATYLRCPDCADRRIVVTELRRARRTAIAAYRAQHRVLAGDELRALRARLRLSRDQLARLLRVSPMTLSRWESEHDVQSAAMDTLLRMIRDLPGSLAYLRKHAA